MEKPFNVLIVDDDSRMAETLKDILLIKGCGADAVHSGPQALKLLADAPYDAILSDIRMPEMDGVDLLKEIRNQFPDIPVLLMTAYSAEPVIRQGLEAGALEVLIKPLDIEALLGFLAELNKK